MHVWRVVGSNRLWDAVENGAIPVMTDPRQYSVVPFESLWRTMTVDLNVNTTSSASVIAKSLMAKSEEVRGQWSTLMAALATGRHIVAWRDPHSVTLRAYVQLLVDRIKAQPCGPCVRNANRKAKCLQPRCSRHTCTWAQISDWRGCGLNADGEAFGNFGSAWVNSTRHCQILCEKDNECLAVDLENKTRRSKVSLKCVMYRKACSNPRSFPAASYRLELRKKM